MKGWHWEFHWPTKVANIPFWPHWIFVVGLGHLTRRGRYYRWVPGGYVMHLDHCCDAREAQRVRR